MVLIMLDGAVNQVCIEHFLLLLPYTLPLKFFCEYNFHNILLTLLKKIGQGNYPRYKRLFRNRTRWVVLGIKKSLMTKWSVLTVARRLAHSSWLTITRNKKCYPSLSMLRHSGQSTERVQLNVGRQKLPLLLAWHYLCRSLSGRPVSLLCLFCRPTMAFCTPVLPGDWLKLYSLHAWLGCSLETSCLWKPGEDCW